MYIPVIKQKGDVQSYIYSKYRGMKLTGHTMKFWERGMEARLKDVTICKQQYGSISRMSAKGVMIRESI